MTFFFESNNAPTAMVTESTAGIATGDRRHGEDKGKLRQLQQILTPVQAHQYQDSHQAHGQIDEVIPNAENRSLKVRDTMPYPPARQSCRKRCACRWR